MRRPVIGESDFVAHVEATIDTDPDAAWIFINDQLDTHRSATDDDDPSSTGACGSVD